jgi:hypothetical protein
MMWEICEIRVLRTEVGAGLLVPAESTMVRTVGLTIFCRIGVGQVVQGPPTVAE